MGSSSGLRPFGHLFCLALAVAGCGGGGGDGPDPTPTPALPKTRIQVLRDAALPRLSLTVDGVGGPTYLVGQRAPLHLASGEAQIAKIDPAACSVTTRWSGLDAYLDAAKANKINLLHVELWTVWQADSLYPFLKDTAGKFKVQAAVENNEWNQDYFRNIRRLVDGASARGIVVFFTLFNHYNIRISDANVGGRPWATEPLRAANSDTNFGLPDLGGNWKLRTAEFVTSRDGAGNLTPIARIQKALIERLMDEVYQDNVIYEPLMVPWIFNNPDLPPLKLAAWQSWVISIIRAKEAALGRGLRSIIEVTPAPTESLDAVVNGGVNKVFDLNEWKRAFNEGRSGYEGWGQVDIIAYTGTFAFGEPPFGGNANVYSRERMLNHTRTFPEKLALYSTDGFNQRYAPDRCTAALGSFVQDVRHGWWDVVDLGNDLAAYPLFWARATADLHTSQVPLGYTHFLNWTTTQNSMEDLGRRTF